MKAFIVCILVLVSLSSSDPLKVQILEMISTKPVEDQFKLWHYIYQRGYDLGSEIGITKYLYFKSNVETINKANSKQSDYTLGLGPFTDMSSEEFTNLFFNNEFEKVQELPKIGSIDYFDKYADSEETTVGINNWEIVDSPDWTSKMTPVKDQLTCGSCWAFAAIATTEAFINIQLGLSVELSEQYLLDCTNSSDCEGAQLRKPFETLQDYGAPLRSLYPYKNEKLACNRAIKLRFKIEKSIGCIGCTSDEINKKLSKGPYAALISASVGLQHYRKGIYTEDCYGDAGHAISVVQGNKQFFKFKNSWGTDWGDQGYGKIANNPSNQNSCHVTYQTKQPITVKQLSS